jgi:hypothetical protein
MIKLVPLVDLFGINYGNSLELINMEMCNSTDSNAIPFVSRTENNNGVSAFVTEELDIELNPAHTLTVAVGGSVLATFYQPLPYYTGFHVLVLSPKNKMSIVEMIFYAVCISANKYKYNYGRQANKTLKDILVPSEIQPDLFDKIIAGFKNSLKSIPNYSVFRQENEDIFKSNLSIRGFANDLVKVSDLFDVVYGINLELVNMIQCKSADINAIPFVSRMESNNGISAFVEAEIDIEPNQAHTLSVAGGGSVLSTFYQPFPYYSGRDVYILIPRNTMNVLEMIFYAKCISANKYKYNYGRQANKTLKDILLPSRPPNGLSDTLMMKQVKTSNLLKNYTDLLRS